MSRLRPRLTPALEIQGGHIGYNVPPSVRRKGYGTQLLRLTLPKARAAGLSRVLLTVDSSNVASIRIIERNGGRVESEGYVGPLGGPYAATPSTWNPNHSIQPMRQRER